MALKFHLSVPGVRLPTRKERKSRLRLLDSDDEDYEKGERPTQPLCVGSQLIVISNSRTPLRGWLAPQEQESPMRLPDFPNRGSRISDTTISAVLVRNTPFDSPTTKEIERGLVIQSVELRARYKI